MLSRFLIAAPALLFSCATPPMSEVLEQASETPWSSDAVDALFHEDLPEEFRDPPDDWRDQLVWLIAVEELDGSVLRFEGSGEVWRHQIERIQQRVEIDEADLAWEAMSCALLCQYYRSGRSPLFRTRVLEPLCKRAESLHDRARLLAEADGDARIRARAVEAMGWLALGFLVLPPDTRTSAVLEQMRVEWQESALRWLPRDSLGSIGNGAVLSHLGARISFFLGYGDGDFPERYGVAWDQKDRLMSEMVGSQEVHTLLFLAQSLPSEETDLRLRHAVYSEVLGGAQRLSIVEQVALLRSVLPSSERMGDRRWRS